MLICKVSLLPVILLASLVLTSCITTKLAIRPNSSQWDTHLKAVQQIRQYQTRGSFAYLSDKKKVYAHFFLQQFSPEHYRLVLTNPLGITEADLNVWSNVVQLTDHHGKHYVSDNAEEMIYKLSNLVIPLNNLREWILGLPGGSNNFTLDDQYHLRSLKYKQGHLSWMVDYQDYGSDIIPQLPIQLELKQDDQHIKLKIDNWKLK